MEPLAPVAALPYIAAAVAFVLAWVFRDGIMGRIGAHESRIAALEAKHAASEATSKALDGWMNSIQQELRELRAEVRQLGRRDWPSE